MLHEVAAKLQRAGWVVVVAAGESEAGRKFAAVAITGTSGKPVIGVNEQNIITLDGVPVTEVLQ